MTKNSNIYDEKYMKIKSKSDDELQINKTIEIHSIIIVDGAVFHENNKYIGFLDDCQYKI